jgi:hypothetical protein
MRRFIICTVQDETGPTKWDEIGGTVSILWGIGVPYRIPV